jgi:hypothetical protein
MRNDFLYHSISVWISVHQWLETHTEPSGDIFKISAATSSNRKSSPAPATPLDALYPLRQLIFLTTDCTHILRASSRSLISVFVHSIEKGEKSYG